MEATPDVFGGPHVTPGGPSLITDGTWLWRADPVHYAAHYPLRFDPELVAFVRAHDYMPPEVDLTDELYEQIDEYFGCTG
ncbi:hypothetical protein [Allonocardiopsis opalescens]|nr:hypothetical protein [Allonocardiopsis opalescens]